MSQATLDNQVRRGIGVEIASILWMVAETWVAIAAGITAHSLALVAFGVDSIVELLAGVVLLWRLWLESRGQNAEKIRSAEKHASWVVGCALLVLAVYIVASALHNLYNIKLQMLAGSASVSRLPLELLCRSCPGRKSGSERRLEAMPLERMDIAA